MNCTQVAAWIGHAAREKSYWVEDPGEPSGVASVVRMKIAPRSLGRHQTRRQRQLPKGDGGSSPPKPVSSPVSLGALA